MIRTNLQHRIKKKTETLYCILQAAGWMLPVVKVVSGMYHLVWPQSHGVEVIWDQRQPIQSSFWPAWRVLKNWQKKNWRIWEHSKVPLQPISLNCQRLHECLQTSLSCSILFTLDWSRQTFDPWRCDGLMCHRAILDWDDYISIIYILYDAVWY